MPEISVGDVNVKPGSKAFGHLRIGESPSSPIDLPIGVINGRVGGPTLCIVAGTQACEYAGIDAAIRIFADTNPTDVHGAIITVPTLNLIGFDRATPVVCPIDGLNLAFQFPGKPNGSLSQITAYHVWNQIATKADYVVDLHGGDINEYLVPYPIVYQTGNNKVDQVSLELAKLFETEYIELRTQEGGGRLWPVSMLFVEASKLGKPSLVSESGMLAAYDENDIQRHVNGVTNVMKYVGILEGKPSKHSTKQKLWSDVIEVTVRHGGLFYLESKLGEPVSKGQKIGHVKSLSGDVVEEVLAPGDGFILLVFVKRVVYSGEVAVILGTNVRDI